MRRLALAVSTIAIIFFLGSILFLHLADRTYNPLVYGISYYALGAYAILIGLAFGLMGLAGMNLSLLLWEGGSSTSARMGILLLFLWGIFCILAGLFPLDPPNLQWSLSGWIHNIAGRNVLLFLPAVFLIEYNFISPDKSTLEKGMTLKWAWFILIAVILLFVFNTLLSSLSVGGLFQRVYWLALSAWLLHRTGDIDGARTAKEQRGAKSDRFFQG
jgi:hypothetical protein